MDHGILNVPLSRRGNIDAQIDAYKKAKATSDAKARKEEYAKLKASRLAAKALVRQTTAQRWEQLAAHAGRSVADVKAHVSSQAHWQPDFVEKLLSRP